MDEEASEIKRIVEKIKKGQRKSKGCRSLSPLHNQESLCRHVSENFLTCSLFRRDTLCSHTVFSILSQPVTLLDFVDSSGTTWIGGLRRETIHL
jgi:hypothetical protein